MAKTQIEHLRELYKDCDLTEEDIFKKTVFNKKAGTSKELVIITRSGVEKIVAQKGIIYKIDSVCTTPQYSCVKITAYMGDKSIETMASASPETTTVSYYPEVAENRGISRAMIKLTKAHGLYSEDDFSEKDFSPSTKSEPSPRKDAVNEAMDQLKKR
jgi:hypothetical protein